MLNKHLLKLFEITLLSILIIITFIPMLHTGFLTADDAERHLEVLNGGIFGGVWGIAEATGRITLAFHIFLTHIPYLSDNIVYRKSLLILSHIATIAYFAFVLSKYLRSKTIAIIFVVLFMVFLTNSWEHNLYASYPFAFHVSMIAIIGSAHFLKIFTIKNKRIYILISAMLYGLSIAAYEQFTLYVLFFLGYLFSRQYPIKTDRFKKFLGLSIPFILIIILYLSLVISFKFLVSGQYEGTQFARFDSFAFLITLKTFILSSLPIYVPLNYESIISTNIANYKLSIRNLYENFQILWILKIIVASILITFALKKSDWQRKKGVSFLNLISILLILLVFSILLISLSSKYQNWVINSGTLAYSSSTFFAQLFAATLVAVFVCNTVKNSFVNKRHTFVIFIGITFFLTPIVAVTEYNNNNLLALQRNSANKWNAMDSLSVSGVLQKIPSGSIIYAPDFMQTGGIASMREGYWSSYLRVKYGINLEITADRDKYLSGEYFNKRYTVDYKSNWPYEHYYINIIKDRSFGYEFYIKNYELNGFYGEEKRDGIIYRWSKNVSELSICNASNNALDLVFNAKISTDKFKVEPLNVCILGDCRDYRLSNAESIIQENRTFPPGCSKVFFVTKANPVHAPLDSRVLYFQIYDIKLKN